MSVNSLTVFSDTNTMLCGNRFNQFKISGLVSRKSRTDCWLPKEELNAKMKVFMEISIMRRDLIRLFPLASLRDFLPVGKIFVSGRTEVGPKPTGLFSSFRLTRAKPSEVD